VNRHAAVRRQSSQSKAKSKPCKIQLALHLAYFLKAFCWGGFIRPPSSGVKGKMQPVVAFSPKLPIYCRANARRKQGFRGYFPSSFVIPMFAVLKER